nr:NADH deshydrogenase subunit 6 [Odontocolon albotibiale]
MMQLMNKSFIDYSNFLMMSIPMFMNMMFLTILITPAKIFKLHPITMMLMLMLFTILMSMKMNFMFKSWMPYILFLIMIGGLMIIFMYITSIANNELFTLNLKNITLLSFKYLIITMIMFFLLKMNFFNLMKMKSIFTIIMDEELINMNYMYMESFNDSMYFLMNYLYYSLICIMNICYKFKLPLRQLNT